MKIPRLPKRQVTVLREQLIERATIIDALTQKVQQNHAFITVTMRHVGQMEGQAKLTNKITLSPEESRDVIRAAEIYQRALQH